MRTMYRVTSDTIGTTGLVEKTITLGRFPAKSVLVGLVRPASHP